MQDQLAGAEQTLQASQSALKAAEKKTAAVAAAAAKERAAAVRQAEATMKPVDVSLQIKTRLHVVATVIATCMVERACVLIARVYFAALALVTTISDDRTCSRATRPP